MTTPHQPAEAGKPGEAGKAPGIAKHEPAPAKPATPARPKEIGGAPGPEPTRYGDWQHKGRVTDF